MLLAMCSYRLRMSWKGAQSLTPALSMFLLSMAGVNHTIAITTTTTAAHCHKASTPVPKRLWAQMHWMLSSGFCNLHAAGTATQFHLRVSCLNGKLQAAEPRLVKNVKLVTVPMMYDRALQMILMNVGMMMYARALRMILMTAGMVMYEGAGAGALVWSITESHKPNQKLNRPLNPRHMKQQNKTSSNCSSSSSRRRRHGHHHHHRRHPSITSAQLHNTTNEKQNQHVTHTQNKRKKPTKTC